MVLILVSGNEADGIYPGTDVTRLIFLSASLVYISAQCKCI